MEVVAALIREDGRFLICQRGAEKSRALLWEFAGGKVEPGESREAALARECREELAIELEVGPVFMEAEHVYPDVTIHLTLLEARIIGGRPQRLEHNDLRWITPGEIGNYAFCPADQAFLDRLETEARPSSAERPMFSGGKDMEKPC